MLASCYLRIDQALAALPGIEKNLRSASTTRFNDSKLLSSRRVARPLRDLLSLPRLTFTLEALVDEAVEKGAAVVAECRAGVCVHLESVLGAAVLNVHVSQRSVGGPRGTDGGMGIVGWVCCWLQRNYI